MVSADPDPFLLVLYRCILDSATTFELPFVFLWYTDLVLIHPKKEALPQAQRTLLLPFLIFFVVISVRAF